MGKLLTLLASHLTQEYYERRFALAISPKIASLWTDVDSTRQEIQMKGKTFDIENGS